MRRTRVSLAVCHTVLAILDSFGVRRRKGQSQLAGVVEALEQKFPCSREHSDRVVEFSKVIADELPIPAEKVFTICQAARLHDVGKIGVPGEILTKPGPLTEQERRVIKTHPRVAANLLKRLFFPRECIDLVYHHHEWFDGNGYPGGAGGKDIPLGARVIAVADAFDAMISDRPYRKAMSVDDASRELQYCAGSQFDPDIVDAFTRAFQKGALALRQGR